MTPIEHKPTSRVLDILELLSNSFDGYSITEIAEAIQVPKSTLTPIIRTLMQRKFIDINKNTGKYIIGFSSYIIGNSALPHLDVMTLIQSHMKHMVATTCETCQLGILIDGEVLYLAKEESSASIRLISFVGNRLPAYATGIGKALLSDYSLTELKSIYPEPLHAYTQHTITDISLLHKQLELCKRLGYFWEHEEISTGIYCYSIPLRYQDTIIAAVSTSIPKFRFTSDKEEIIIQSLKDIQQKLETIFDTLDMTQEVFYSTMVHKK